MKNFQRNVDMCCERMTIISRANIREENKHTQCAPRKSRVPNLSIFFLPTNTIVAAKCHLYKAKFK